MAEIVLNELDFEYESLPTSSFALQALAGGFAGVLEHTVMYPVDSLKTRVQCAGAGSSASRSVLRSVASISRQEGPLALWRGVSSVVLGAGPSHVIYFGLYEYLKQAMQAGQQDGTHRPVGVGAAATVATLVSEAVMNPFDVVKQRMQLALPATAPQGLPGGPPAGMVATGWRIYTTEGLGAFFSSYPTTVSMAIPFTVVNFVSYESLVTLVNPSGAYDPATHCVCGGLAGGLAAAVTTPLDCVKTLLQVHQINGSSVEVASFGRAIRIIHLHDGLAGFWRGLRPRVVYNIPSTALCWTAYEMAKYYLL